jgi:predicted house-cleaning noncanonical NTP pyrophosphatase (MazG superfamily)
MSSPANGRNDRRLVKLVRDDVERFCGGDTMVRYERMSDDEYVKALRAKLIEEAVEYALDPTEEELGDVWEVLNALANVEHRGIAAVGRAAIRKSAHKGSFDGHVGMYLHVAEEHRD